MGGGGCFDSRLISQSLNSGGDDGGSRFSSWLGIALGDIHHTLSLLPRRRLNLMVSSFITLSPFVRSWLGCATSQQTHAADLDGSSLT